ncbi:Uncharacterised protein [Legionella busanensis]|uniref:Uncharacterized protein n=1 Tax=Legionella busanensis TaxID=190655 RepID=A0A378JRK1_9GAMM|nr:hypothetical protein [Legionella busanensis]STX50762.1 Uncharacterised protein [Legionella busanensis]
MINLNKRKIALKQIKLLIEKPENVLLIHYSCESFYDRDSMCSPRITSIAVTNLYSRQTHSFSIHQEAEIRGKLDDIDNNYDFLEREMLTKFYKFVDKNSMKKWVHWNMKNSNYGFLAIEHRFKVLGGEPIVISDQDKIDLNSLLIDIYGVGYIGHPRLEKLIDKNNISKSNFLSGQNEADAFEKKDYLKLHQSTLRKTDIFCNILERINNKKLKTNLNFSSLQGNRILYFIDWFNNHSIIVFLLAISGWIFGFLQLFYN